MNPVDALVMALTPGSLFNQNEKVFRSTKALAQFAGVEQGEVLQMIADNLADQVTIRPSAKHPDRGPLVALTEFLADQEEPPEAPQIQVVAGNAVRPFDEAEVRSPRPDLPAPHEIPGEATDNPVVDEELGIRRPPVKGRLIQELLVEDDEPEDD